MGFLTKIDTSDNRQARQRIETSTHYSGATVLGVTFDMLPTGPSTTDSGVTSTITGATATFSGNSGTTNFSWYDPRMNLATGFSAITPTNTGETQSTGFLFAPNLTGTSLDGYPITLTYSGVSFDMSPTTFINLGGGNYSGTVFTYDIDFLSAGTIDFTGSTIWLDVSGITRTNGLIFTDNPVVGYVVTCIDTDGTLSLQPSSGSSATTVTTYWSAGTGTKSIVVKGFQSTAGGDYAVAEGFQTSSDGNYSITKGYRTWTKADYGYAEGYTSTAGGTAAHAEGYLTSASGNYSHSEGSGTTAIGSASHSEGGLTTATGAYSHAGGNSSAATGATSFVHGSNSRAHGSSTIVLGSNITGTTADTTYVDNLNIKTVGVGPGVTDIGVDANGFVVNQASDLRMKKNISTIENALDKVKQLRGVKYQWNDEEKGGSEYRLGFIAQEVYEVEPLLSFVNTSTSENYMGVLYKDVPALLVEAIKELVSDEVVINKTYLETQSIIAEDNNIDLNYGGTKETAINGGIRVINGLGDENAEFILNEDGNWVTNNGFKPKNLTLPTGTPSSTNDVMGNIGDVLADENYIYVKTQTGWKRSSLTNF
jgi:hypothetical protein